jgi:TPR repeat protein
MLIQGEGGPKRPAQGRRYLDRAAALGQIDALKVLAYALSHGEYSYQTSHTRAKAIKRALRQALSRARKYTAG